MEPFHDGYAYTYLVLHLYVVLHIILFRSVVEPESLTICDALTAGSPRGKYMWIGMSSAAALHITLI